MRRMLLGLAIAAIAATAPHWCLAGEQEDVAAVQEIARILRDSGRMQKYSVGVKYSKGTVWLAGRVTSKAQMQAALEVVSEVDGVQQIVNNLQVDKSSTDKPSTSKSTAAKKNSAVRQVAAEEAAPVRSATTAKKKKSKVTTVGGTKVYRGVPTGYAQLANDEEPAPMQQAGRPLPAYIPGTSGGVAPAAYDQPSMPNYSWPSYAAYPNYAAVTYPKQYSATAWPYIGPFYPYPQVPMGWRKVSLEWDDGWWFLDFDDRGAF